MIHRVLIASHPKYRGIHVPPFFVVAAATNERGLKII
jgi:hypothetical protein